MRQFSGHEATQAALLQVHATDSVAVCLRDPRTGECLSFAGGVIQVGTDTSRGHKIALRAHQCGEVVIKCGHGIGYAMVDLAPTAGIGHS